MHNELKIFSPQVPALPETIEVAAVTRQFYHEVEHRQAFGEHCAWYEKTAAQNQRDLLAMRRELNLFRWFVRR